MHTYIYIYIHIYIFTYMYIYICIYIYVYIYMYIYTYIYTHIFSHIFIHTYINIYMYEYMYIYRYVYISIHICQYTRKTYGVLLGPSFARLHALHRCSNQYIPVCVIQPKPHQLTRTSIDGFKQNNQTKRPSKRSMKTTQMHTHQKNQIDAYQYITFASAHT